MTRPPHRVHVWPWLRHIGRRVLPNWLAITLGPHILAWRAMTADELEHELAHVGQWRRYGWRFPFLYLRDSMRARRTADGWYLGNRFEREAREAARRARAR